LLIANKNLQILFILDQVGIDRANFERAEKIENNSGD